VKHILNLKVKKKKDSFKYRNSQGTFAELQLVIRLLILNGKLCINVGKNRNLCIITRLPCPGRLVPIHIYSEAEMREYYIW